MADKKLFSDDQFSDIEEKPEVIPKTSETLPWEAEYDREYNDISGKRFILKLPQNMHEELTLVSGTDDRSIQKVIINMLKPALKKKLIEIQEEHTREELVRAMQAKKDKVSTQQEAVQKTRN
jgi:AAA+ superfamily predicted ATPase